MRGRINQITVSELRAAVEVSDCYRDVLEHLGFRRNSGTMWSRLKKLLAEQQISVSHFGKRQQERRRLSRRIYDLNEILVQDSKYENIGRLKRRLVAEAILDYQCEICGNAGQWNGRPLSLQLDHRNGVPNDHRIQNLRFLCPNCHSQTDTYSGRNRMTGSTTQLDTRPQIGVAG